MTDRSAEAIELEAVMNQLKPILRGRPPEIQGAAIADLAAVWLAAHAPQYREESLARLIKLVRDLTGVEEKIMFGEAGHPGGMSYRQ